MFVKCKGLGEGRINTDLNGFLKMLTVSGLLNKKGEPKEVIEVYTGGPVFNGKSHDNKGFPWTFSSFDLDRDEERIDPRGWELTHYLKNPVVLWAHDSRIPAIGYSERTAVDSDLLQGNVVFNRKEIDEFGWGIGQRVAARVIRAGSVGFLILKVEIVGEGEESRLFFRNQELLEFSICNVPSNPFALAQEPEKESGKKPLQRFFFLEDFPDASAIPEAETQLNKFWKGLIKNLE